MAPTLFERLALRGIRPPTSAKLAGQCGAGAVAPSAAAGAPAIRDAAAPRAVVAEDRVAPVVAPASDDEKPLLGADIRGGLAADEESRQRPRPRKRKQPPSVGPPAVEVQRPRSPRARRPATPQRWSATFEQRAPTLGSAPQLGEAAAGASATETVRRALDFAGEAAPQPGAMSRCRKCSTENTSTQKFCNECGEQLDQPSGRDSRRLRSKTGSASGTQRSPPQDGAGVNGAPPGPVAPADVSQAAVASGNAAAGRVESPPPPAPTLPLRGLKRVVRPAPHAAAPKAAPRSRAPPPGSPARPRLLATPQRASKAAARTASPKSKALAFNEAPETCSICCDDVAASQAVRLRCQHGWYCTSCMARCVEARLDMGTVQQACPECKEELAEHELKSMIPQELMDRLLARSLEQAVASTADLRPCPTPNCPMRVALEADDTGQFSCTLCEKSSCLRCGAQPYHRRLTCEQHAAKMQKQKKRRDSTGIFQWMKKTGSKQCPSCKMVVTKETIKNQDTQQSECHKMMCRNCGTRFCFKCLAILTENYSCGCTKDEHGFVDPHTGKYVAHFNKKSAKAARSGETRRNAAGGA